MHIIQKLAGKERLRHVFCVRIIEAPSKLSEWHSPWGVEILGRRPATRLRDARIQQRLLKASLAEVGNVQDDWTSDDKRPRCTASPVLRRPWRHDVVKGGARAWTELSVQGQEGRLGGARWDRKARAARQCAPSLRHGPTPDTRENGRSMRRDGCRGQSGERRLVMSPCCLVARLTQPGGGVTPRTRPSRSPLFYLVVPHRERPGGCAEERSCVCEANGYEERPTGTSTRTDR